MQVRDLEYVTKTGELRGSNTNSVSAHVTCYYSPSAFERLARSGSPAPRRWAGTARVGPERGATPAPARLGVTVTRSADSEGAAVAVLVLRGQEACITAAAVWPPGEAVAREACRTRPAWPGGGREGVRRALGGAP